MSFRKKLKSKAANLRGGGNGGETNTARRAASKAGLTVRRGGEVAKERAQQMSARDVLLSALAEKNSEIREPSMADRAREAGEARAPIDAELDPSGDPRAMESFASGGLSADIPGQAGGGEPLGDGPRDDDPMNASSGMGISDSGQEPLLGQADYDDEDNPLEFDDDGFFGGDD